MIKEKKIIKNKVMSCDIYFILRKLSIVYISQSNLISKSYDKVWYIHHHSENFVFSKNFIIYYIFFWEL